MDDVAPGIRAKIQADFNSGINSDADIAGILRRVEAGNATPRDIQYYAIKVGDHAAAALSKNITADALPDGKLYYNIARRTVLPQLQDNYELVEKVAEQIQKQLNTSAGIGLNPTKVWMDQNRANGIITKLTSTPDFDSVAWMLNEPIKNFTQHVADAFVQRNAESQSRAGLSPRVTREVYGNCCDWCANLAGTYDYGKQPDEFFAKHEYCRCLVIYDPRGSKRQNVHTKQWFEDERAARVEHAQEMQAQAAERQDAERQARIARAKAQR